MDLKEYFQKTQGTGVLATADTEGKVDAAIYSRPYIIDDQTLVFIMTDRLTRKNLQSNPQAAFLFLESPETYEGKRLFLTKIKEGTGSEEPDEVLRQKYDKACEEYKDETLFLVYFRVENIRSLVG